MVYRLIGQTTVLMFVTLALHKLTIFAGYPDVLFGGDMTSPFDWAIAGMSVLATGYVFDRVLARLASEGGAA